MYTFRLIITVLNVYFFKKKICHVIVIIFQYSNISTKVLVAT